MHRDGMAGVSGGLFFQDFQGAARHLQRFW
jgi:hypothetical protein